MKTLIDFQIKPEKSDELIFLGDYIDRGPDSKGVVDYIMDLEKEGFWVTALMGNHEDYCITAWEEDQDVKSFLGIRPKTKTQREWEVYGGKQTLDSFDADRPRDIPERYIDWMKKLHYYVERENNIIVHAGLNFELDDPFEDKYAMIWIREYEVIPEKIGHKKIIHGHVPVNLELIDMAIRIPDSKFIDLDNGVYFSSRAGYGNLVAFEISSNEYVVQSLMDEVSYGKFL